MANKNDLDWIRKRVRKHLLTFEAFSPTDYIESHPYSRSQVDFVKSQVKTYIGSLYDDGVEVPYGDWYVGVSRDPNNSRANGHKSKKELKELVGLKSFFSFSLSNARQAEKELCQEFQLGKCKLIGNLKRESKWVYVYNEKYSH